MKIALANHNKRRLKMLTKNQVKTFQKENSDGDILCVTIRHDDRCGNGHNTFSVTGDLFDRPFMRGEPYKINSSGKKKYLGSCGCLHEEIKTLFYEFTPYLRFHLCSTDGPLHYIENSLFWAGKKGFCNGDPGDPPNLENFRSTAIWPEVTASIFDCTESDIVAQLYSRLPALMADFRRTVETLNFTY
jgi:hypothetical protein